MGPDLFQLVADLRAGWHTLHNVHKADLIKKILAAGMKQRTLADAVKCDEKLIRNLALAAEALPQEKLLAQQGKISTRALIRAVRARRQRQSQLHRDAVTTERDQTARRFAQEVLTWLQHDLALASAHAEQVVTEARAMLAQAEACGTLPKETAPQGMPVSEIIRRCRPVDLLTNDNVHIIAGYARWLALWTFFAIPDSWTRDLALNIAWGRLIRR